MNQNTTNTTKTTIDDEPSHDEPRAAVEDVDVDVAAPLVAISKWFDGEVSPDGPEIERIKQFGVQAINVRFDPDHGNTRVSVACKHNAEWPFEPDSLHHMSPEMREAQNWTIPPQPVQDGAE